MTVCGCCSCSLLLEPFKADLKSGEFWGQVLARMRQLLLDAYSKCVSRFEDHMRAERERRTEPGWSFNSYFMLQVRQHWWSSSSVVSSTWPHVIN